ncbi:zinc-ribbon domain-containing protein [Eubacterium callanderi]|uniref:zinc-ribbon domain-containing protein n=1 Tax=Eubacterium callanderi TaxID=53442 RepID=UPI001C10AABD|nr:zinc ribbon domain-containing protein [Eubacterium callanderi]MBU5302152.1 hypothetical protein [Eubacterium callanderi]WPK66500.1 hypothetical protein EUCA2A_06280 [Eubacterium callanderi]WPK70798.1 hypothetical protein EUCA11A_06280 [Eubacterium callanderi]
MRKCRECGAKLKKETEFCEQCGTKQSYKGNGSSVKNKRNLGRDIWIITGTGVLVLLLIIVFSFLIRMSMGSVQKLNVGVNMEEPYMEPMKIVKEALQSYDNQKAESVWLPILVEKEFIKYTMDKDRWEYKQFDIVSADSIDLSQLTEEKKNQLYDELNFSDNEEVKKQLNELTDLVVVAQDWAGIAKEPYYTKSGDEAKHVYYPVCTSLWYVGKWHDQWCIISGPLISQKLT